jgi:SAM-dependent methyltransferase
MTGYASRQPLGARLSLYDYQVDRVDLPGEALRLLGNPAGPVLDVGCGLGGYVDRLETVGRTAFGLDESAAMARHVRGDAGALPVASGSCGAALAMHMLYHVADVGQAVRELRRVVRSGGVVLASTNGRDDKVSLYALFEEVQFDVATRFTLDDDAALRESFDAVVRHQWVREIVVPVPGPLDAYLASIGLPPEVEARGRARVRAAIEETGAFRTTSVVGIFACR